jgi:curli biogenesis system outer membrane secretion channel CsgG
MARVWVVVLSVWAMLAIVAVLAWSSRPTTPLPAASAQTVVVKAPNGKQKVVVLKAPAHATTATSAVAGR